MKDFLTAMVGGMIGAVGGILVFIIIMIFLVSCGRYQQLETIPAQDEQGLLVESDEDLTPPVEPECSGSCYTRGECEMLYGGTDAH